MACLSNGSASVYDSSRARAERAVRVRFHITYSLTWAAPVLYLKAVWHDGSTLRPKDVCNELYFEQDDDAAALLSVEDHPFLNEAWCMLHACQTPERMAAIRETAPQMRLLSWFAFTAPTMGLRISPKQWARLVGHLRSGQDAPLFEIEDSDAR
ncbi:hypothetical protein M885DRAFT_529555 [Pelagophyceae sp. CCMP2097]|nr:hypothetical protein M885DRAFT_529555 [Pelagophyceae sp. CCMP2097]|mmetsp:Transcript_7529/g.26294  ORF Transcript_7529/g.26294 Transcript_7529/m.26294 type:complete len:154 (+) Transcript_7529:296-757(+)